MSEEEHFQRLVELPAEQREEYMSGLNDPELADRLRRLLSAHSDENSLLSAAEMETTSANFGSAPTTMIGPYKLLQKIGEGGMGSVFVAQQERPVRRKVALKVIRSDRAGKEVIARFEAERQSLALMDHPNIAKVLDAGTDTDGQPYFAMELVKGIPITQYCDDNRLSTDERVRLMVDVCHAVQHAHQKGIIHRDLKPSNILVAQYDDRPVPKVIDFGVAKAMHQKLTEKTLHTHFGQIVGTLEYMSPEQAVLNQLDVDTRSDVYSLGVVLYELLVGDPPLRSDQLRQQPFDQILRTIREQEPARPSLRLSSQGKAAAQTAAYRATDASSLSRALRGDLDWIVMKTLEKSRSRRYESASQLGKDLESFLAGTTVDARPPSMFYRMEKTWRRNRLAITSVAAIILALAIGLATAVYQRNQAQHANHQTQQALLKAENALSVVRQYCMLLAMTGDPQDEARALAIAGSTNASPTFRKMISSQSALFRGESRKAVQLLKEGVDAEPNNIPCRALLGIAEIVSGNMDGFLATMADIEKTSPDTAEEKAYAAYALIMDGEKALSMIRPVIEKASSPLFDVFYADIVREASETDPTVPIPDAMNRLNKVRDLVGNNVMIAQVSLKLHHAALLRCKDLDAESLKSQARRDIAILRQHQKFSLADAHMAMYLENFADSVSERDAAWQRLLENPNAGYFQSLPVFAFTMRIGAYGEAAALLKNNDGYAARIRRAVCLFRSEQLQEAEDLYASLKRQKSTRLHSHLDYISFVGDVDRLVRESEAFLNDDRPKSDLIRCTAALFADPDNDAREQDLRSVAVRTPRTGSMVLGRIALLRLLQAEAAEDPIRRRAYQRAADDCIDEILASPLVNRSYYYWAKSMRESARSDDASKVDDVRAELERVDD